MKIVLLHGLGQDGGSWRETAAVLRGREVLCPELAPLLRGGEARYSALYRQVEMMLDGIEPPFCLAGLSLGGMLALQYAAAHPGRLAALALIGTQVRAPKGLLRVQNALFRLMPSSAFGETGLEKAEMIELCTSMMELDLTGLMGQVTCPALVVCGERDWANRAAARALCEGLPRGELAVVTGAGHEVNREAPRELGALLDDFFRRKGG